MPSLHGNRMSAAHWKFGAICLLSLGTFGTLCQLNETNAATGNFCGGSQVLQDPQPSKPLADPVAQRKQQYQRQWAEVRQRWNDDRDVDSLSQLYLELRKDYSDQTTLEIEIAEHLAAVLRQSGSRLAERRSSWLPLVERSLESLTTNDLWNGAQSVDLPFRTVAALRGISSAVKPLSGSATERGYQQIGAIARRLKQNPKFLSQNTPALATWLWDEARGHAMANQGQAALSSIRQSLQWGLVDFEEVLEDELLLALPNHAEISQVVKASQGEYENRMRQGIGQAIQRFQSFSFRFSCNSLTGARVTESHFQGKWVVVDLWGTWCIPCRAEIPHLARLHREFQSQGWEVVGIAIEQGATEAENRKLVQDFVEKESVPYRCLLGDESLLKQIPQQKTLPSLVFINPQGKVVFAAQGYHDYTQLRVILETLKSTPRVTRPRG